MESRELWVAVIYSAVIGLVTLVLPVATQTLVNTVAFGTVLQPLVVLTALVFIALLFGSILNGYRLWVVELIQRRIFVRISGDVTHRLVRVQPEAFDQHHGPELVNRFLEVVTVQKAAATLLVDGLTVVFSATIGMILLAIYHPWLLAFDIFLLILFNIILFPFGIGAIPTAVKESTSKFALVAWMEEIARHQIAFKTKSGAELASSRTNALVMDYLGHRARHFRILLRQIVSAFVLQALASAVLLGVGGWLVIQRQLTLGQLVAAELIVALVLASFTKFGKHLEAFYDLMASVDKIGYLADLPVERTDGEAVPARTNGARIRMHIHRAGHMRARPVLSGIEWEIPAGAKYGLVGCAGSGKSFLFDTLYLFRAPEDGWIEFDGKDTRDLSLDDLRQQIGLVRKPEVFDGTIIENLRLGRYSLDTAEAREALTKAGLIEEVQALPDGLNARLQTGGSPLSSSQAIRLELARALANKPRLLLLDECLDFLEDVPGRGDLLDRLLGPSALWTVIVATQSEEILSRCDKVFRLEGGEVREVAR
ncbi:MAG: ABC transporter ATP-binding protein [Candidatus Solibacter sp.]|nr:ABC transporter ATP-binding protein [Candidatus Solibacter sp.]